MFQKRKWTNPNEKPEFTVLDTFRETCPNRVVYSKYKGTSFYSSPIRSQREPSQPEEHFVQVRGKRLVTEERSPSLERTTVKCTVNNPMTTNKTLHCLEQKQQGESKTLTKSYNTSVKMTYPLQTKCPEVIHLNLHYVQFMSISSRESSTCYLQSDVHLCIQIQIQTQIQIRQKRVLTRKGLPSLV